MSARVYAIVAFRLTTAEPERLASFYRQLGFTAGEQEQIPQGELALLGLKGCGTRLPLHLGAQRLDLDCFDQRGRAYPPGASSADLCFQHLALVTDSVASAWGRAAAAGATSISRQGPVTLPAAAGGVTAIKFRDPEGHPLEFLQFPPDSEGQWRGRGLLGIDHSAISVSEKGASRRFYAALGLSVRGATLNHGPEQAALDGLSEPMVDVVAMATANVTPHLELLAYRGAADRAAGPLQANDVAATRIVWRADRDTLLRDPDNHLQLLIREIA